MQTDGRYTCKFSMIIKSPCYQVHNDNELLLYICNHIGHNDVDNLILKQSKSSELEYIKLFYVCMIILHNYLKIGNMIM